MKFSFQKFNSTLRNMKKRSIYLLIIIVFMLFAPTAIFAEYNPNADGYIGDPDATATNVPIDDGLGILVVAGIAYGIKKTYDQKKKLVSDV